jgi:hypothetical protein
VSGKVLTLAKVPVELRDLVGLREPREHPYPDTLRQVTAVIFHYLDYGVLHPQHGYAVDDLDQVESWVAIDKVVGCSSPLV